MGNFEKKRADAIKRKNEAYSKAEGFDKQSEKLSETRSEVKDSKSRIPDDLPEDIKRQIDAMYDSKEKELEDQAKDLADKIKDAQDDADEAIDDMRSMRGDLEKKAEKLSGLKDVPLVGSFMETKSKELDEQAEQMADLAKETQKYSDKLAESRNRLLRRP